MKYEFINASDKKFYTKMGKFFASRQIRKEIGGYPLNNEEDWLWAIAVNKNNVVGFICIEPTKNILLMHDCYVDGLYRDNGVFDSLLKNVMDYAENEYKELSASVNEKLQSVFEKRGFIITGRRGRWLTMRRKHDENICK